LALTDVFRVGGTCVETRHDDLLVAFTKQELLDRIEMFGDLSIPNDLVSAQIGVDDTRTWSVAAARRTVASSPRLPA